MPKLSAYPQEQDRFLAGLVDALRKQWSLYRAKRSPRDVHKKMRERIRSKGLGPTPG